MKSMEFDDPWRYQDFQQNGIVERKNKTNFEIARIMLKSKRFWKEFWVEIIASVVYLSNQSLTKIV